MTGYDLRGAHPRYIRYKPGTSCLVAYRFLIDDEYVEGYVKAYPADDPKLGKAQQRAGTDGWLGTGRVVLDELAIEVVAFPNDNKLPALARCATPDQRRTLLSRVLPGRSDVWDSQAELLRYKPERRCVTRLVTGETAQAVVKFYTETGYTAAQHGRRAFVATGPLRLARVLGRSQRHRIVVSEWLSGHMLDRLIADPTQSDVASRALPLVGQALAALHMSPNPGLPARSTGDEEADLLAASEAITAVCPRLAVQAQRCVRRLRDELSRDPMSRRPTHGDFYAEQVVLTDRSVGILDLDRAMLSDPAADVGSFIAHLERAVQRGTLPAARAEQLGSALLAGYVEAAGDLPRSRVLLFVAAGVFKLAVEPFRRLDPEWPMQIAALLDRAESVIEDACSPTRHTWGVPTASVRT